MLKFYVSWSLNHLLDKISIIGFAEDSNTLNEN